MSQYKYLIGITGSIAAYKTCSLISELKKQGHHVRVIATPSALRFIGEATLEGLSEEKVHSDLYQSGDMMEHIHLARWADRLIIAPATANTLNKLSAGIGDDFLSTLFLAFESHKPCWIAPAMNTKMYQHPATQKSLEVLKSWGNEIIHSPAGSLACGETGPGRMAEVNDILHLLNPPSQSKYKLLVCYGGTQEPIDGVRSITNLSTGNTGSQLSFELSKLGFSVDVLRAKNSVPTAADLHQKTFSTFENLDHQLRQMLSTEEYSAVIHLAAVSDYSLDKIEIDGQTLEPDDQGKLDSQKPLSLKLKPTFKILDRLKEYSKNKNIRVIGFKLTNTQNEKEQSVAINKQLNSDFVDGVVHNDLNEMSSTTHPFHIYNKDGATVNVNGAHQLALKISEAFL